MTGGENPVFWLAEVSSCVGEELTGVEERAEDVELPARLEAASPVGAATGEPESEFDDADGDGCPWVVLEPLDADIASLEGDVVDEDSELEFGVADVSPCPVLEPGGVGSASPVGSGVEEVGLEFSGFVVTSNRLARVGDVSATVEFINDPCWGNAEVITMHRRPASRLEGMALSNMATSVRVVENKQTSHRRFRPKEEKTSVLLSTVCE
jgi:hypothetical protein